MVLRADSVVVDIVAIEIDTAVYILEEGLWGGRHSMERGDRLLCDREHFI